MKQRVLFSLASCAVLALLIGLLPNHVSAQEPPAYSQWETMYLTVKPGHADALGKALADHNRRFHAEGPYTAYVEYVVTGPHTGDLLWRMGPATYGDLDGRPTGDAHDSDWDRNVLVHCEKAHTTEYWRLNEEISLLADPEASSDSASPPLVRVRFFEVADNELFQKVQGQIVELQKATGVTRPRVMFRNQDLNREGRDWITVTFYANWGDRDEDSPFSSYSDFMKAFEDVHGKGSFATFDEEFDKAVLSREDEWRQLIPEMSGTASDGN